MKIDPLEVENLVNSCIGKKAWHELYKKFEKLVYFWVRNILISKGYNSFNFENDVEDIFCSVWEKVFHKLHSLKDPKKFPGWLKTITVHTVIDSMSKSDTRTVSINDVVTKNGNTREEFMEAEDNIEEKIIEKQEIQELKNAMKKLDEEERFILIQHFWNGLKLEDIGKMLNKPIGTIGSLIGRAKTKLREVIKDESIFI